MGNDIRFCGLCLTHLKQLALTVFNVLIIKDATTFFCGSYPRKILSSKFCLQLWAYFINFGMGRDRKQHNRTRYFIFIMYFPLMNLWENEHEIMHHIDMPIFSILPPSIISKSYWRKSFLERIAIFNYFKAFLSPYTCPPHSSPLSK